MKNIFEEINWPLLRKQKETVIGMRKTDELLTEEEVSALSGILHLIDQLQDAAVEYGFTEKHIFGSPVPFYNTLDDIQTGIWDLQSKMIEQPENHEKQAEELRKLVSTLEDIIKKHDL